VGTIGPLGRFTTHHGLRSTSQWWGGWCGVGWWCVRCGVRNAYNQQNEQIHCHPHPMAWVGCGGGHLWGGTVWHNSTQCGVVVPLVWGGGGGGGHVGPPPTHRTVTLAYQHSNSPAHIQCVVMYVVVGSAPSSPHPSTINEYVQEIIPQMGRLKGKPPYCPVHTTLTGTTYTGRLCGMGHTIQTQWNASMAV